jgi:hypothetical protein
LSAQFEPRHLSLDNHPLQLHPSPSGPTAAPAPTLSSSTSQITAIPPTICPPRLPPLALTQTYTDEDFFLTPSSNGRPRPYLDTPQLSPSMSIALTPPCHPLASSPHASRSHLHISFLEVVRGGPCVSTRSRFHCYCCSPLSSPCHCLSASLSLSSSLNQRPLSCKPNNPIFFTDNFLPTVHPTHWPVSCLVCPSPPLRAPPFRCTYLLTTFSAPGSIIFTVSSLEGHASALQHRRSPL